MAKRTQSARAAQQAAEDRVAAERAGSALTATAQRDGATVALSWGSLRELCRMPSVRYVTLIAGDDRWCCRRTKLRELRRGMRPFAPLCWLDQAGLHLRWHEGRGGLDLRTDYPVWGEDTSSFDVTVAGHEQPAPTLVECSPESLSEPPASVDTGPPRGPEVCAASYSAGFWNALCASGAI